LLSNNITGGLGLKKINFEYEKSLAQLTVSHSHELNMTHEVMHFNHKEYN